MTALACRSFDTGSPFYRVPVDEPFATWRAERGGKVSKSLSQNSCGRTTDLKQKTFRQRSHATVPVMVAVSDFFCCSMGADTNRRVHRTRHGSLWCSGCGRQNYRHRLSYGGGKANREQRYRQLHGPSATTWQIPTDGAKGRVPAYDPERVHTQCGSDRARGFRAETRLG